LTEWCGSYLLMLRCWDAEPAERPGFSELSSSVSHIIDTMKAAAATQQHQQQEDTHQDRVLTRPSNHYINEMITSKYHDDQPEHYLQPVVSTEHSPAAAATACSNCISHVDDVDDDNVLTVDSRCADCDYQLSAS